MEVRSVSVDDRIKPGLSLSPEIQKMVDDGELIITPATEEGRRKALEGLPEVRRLRERILARRGGTPIPNLEEALHEARAAHERGE